MLDTAVVGRWTKFAGKKTQTTTDAICRIVIGLATMHGSELCSIFYKKNIQLPYIASKRRVKERFFSSSAG
jgi:hypothetical protein